MKDLENKFWPNVKSQMRKNKISQKETAEGAGINWNTFRGWIHKDILPVVTDAYFIARFLGVDLDYLITGKETKNMKKVEKIRSGLIQIDRLLGRIK